jgi:hypothetical protein
MVRRRSTLRDRKEKSVQIALAVIDYFGGRCPKEMITLALRQAGYSPNNNAASGPLSVLRAMQLIKEDDGDGDFVLWTDGYAAERGRQLIHWKTKEFVQPLIVEVFARDD